MLECGEKLLRNVLLEVGLVFWGGGGVEAGGGGSVGGELGSGAGVVAEGSDHVGYLGRIDCKAEGADDLVVVLEAYRKHIITCTSVKLLHFQKLAPLENCH